jgi:XTP/dITP diphosphohydrolase
VCEGRLLDRPSGAGGFGYDPLFVPQGFDRPFAELGADVKNRLSHRARALEALLGWWNR